MQDWGRCGPGPQVTDVSSSFLLPSFQHLRVSKYFQPMSSLNITSLRKSFLISRVEEMSFSYRSPLYLQLYSTQPDSCAGCVLYNLPNPKWQLYLYICTFEQTLSFPLVFKPLENTVPIGLFHMVFGMENISLNGQFSGCILVWIWNVCYYCFCKKH